MKRAFLAGAALLSAGALITVFSAANAVPSSKLGRSSSSIGPNELKPSSCSAITLSVTTIGTSGTNSADLLLGSAAA